MPTFSWEKLISAKTNEIERLNGIYGRILDNAGVEKFEGSGKVISPHEVEVTAADGSKKVYSAKTILLAPGGRAWYPDIPVGTSRSLTRRNPALVNLKNSLCSR